MTALRRAPRRVATPAFTTGIRGASACTVRVVLSIFALALLCHVPSARATTYYVSATGRDSNSGTSTTAPFLTIKKAADLTKPGDIVNVMNGTYGPFIISHAGSQSGGYITYQAYPGHHPTVLKNATTYYVSATGKDSNSGTSTAAPFLTIKKAADLTKPGDIVNVMNGAYGPFIISHAGSQSGGYITYRAYPGHHPTVLKNGTTWDGIQVWNSAGGPSYIVVDGFTVVGNAQSITVSQAKSAPDNNNTTNGNCISGGSTVHHVIIRNNTVSYCPGQGIMFTGDYLSIYKNIIHHNSFWSPYDTSGMTIKGTNSDGSTAAKIFVYNNLLYNNENYICNKYQTNPCQITDGEGIIVDSNKSSGYNGRIQIYNNVIYNNGGPGISVNKSQHVDIFNNTTYKNNLSATQPAPYTAHTVGGEITATQSSDVRVLNNINYGTSSVPMIYAGLSSVTGLVWDYNILFGGSGAAPRGAHDLAVNPLFVPSPPFNFHLQTGSPARGSGTSALVPKYDFDGNLRSTGSVVRGAYR